LQYTVTKQTQIAQVFLMLYLHLEDVFLRVFAHLQYVYRTFPVRCQIDV